MDPKSETLYQSSEYQPAPNEVSPEQPYYEKKLEMPSSNPENNEQDIEKGENNSNTYDYDINHYVRRGFILKTYGILITQLLITLGFIFLSFLDSVRNFIHAKSALFYTLLVISIIFTIVILVMFTFCRSTARVVPLNYIFLFAFTLCMSYYCLCVCIFYDKMTVIEALGLTIVATFGLTVYACKTKDDYTYCGFTLFSLLFMLPFALLFFFIFHPVYYVLLIIVAGIVIYSLYIIYDTQLILGELGYEYEVDDYVLAALNLYIDIIYLFIRILQLLSILTGQN